MHKSWCNLVEDLVLVVRGTRFDSHKMSCFPPFIYNTLIFKSGSNAKTRTQWNQDVLMYRFRKEFFLLGFRFYIIPTRTQPIDSPAHVYPLKHADTEKQSQMPFDRSEI